MNETLWTEHTRALIKERLERAEQRRLAKAVRRGGRRGRVRGERLEN